MAGQPQAALWGRSASTGWFLTLLAFLDLLLKETLTPLPEQLPSPHVDWSENQRKPPAAAL